MHTFIPRRVALFMLIFLPLLALPVPAQGQVRVVVDRDFVNIRIVPALGAEVVGNANAGTPFVVTGRSPDNAWYQIEFAGSEAWVGAPVVTVLEGDVNSLPIRDPRTIPYGGTQAPRAGFTDATSDIRATLPNNGVRVRGGPTTAYPVLADAPRFSEFFLLGRTQNSQWVQVNYDGTLGWVAARYIEIQDGRSIIELPVDGIVASQPPLEFRDENEFFGVLRIMRDRLDLAQVSLDEIQAVWTDAALGIVPFCGSYPARPSDFNVPRSIYAQYFALLDPILNDFNAAMGDVRNSIDLLIETCDRPGSSAALISPPVTAGGLEFANSADSEMAGLRRRIDELLPELGPDDCIFAFGGRVDVLPTVAGLVDGRFGSITDNFDDSRTNGYCIDATQLSVGRLELLRADANYGVQVAISPLDDPTNFIATATAGESGQSGTTLTIYPITFPKDGRYLIIISVQIPEGQVPTGDYTLLAADFPFGTPGNNFLTLDEDGNVTLQDVPYSGEGGSGTVTVSDGELNATVDTPIENETTTSTTQTGTVTNDSGDAISVYESASLDGNVVGTLGVQASARVINTITDWYFIELDNGTLGWVQAESVSFVADAVTTDTGDTTTGTTSTDGAVSSTILCPGVTLTCDQLFTCTEVQACLNAGSTVLDPNDNGVACDASDGLNPLGCNVPVTSP